MAAVEAYLKRVASEDKAQLSSMCVAWKRGRHYKPDEVLKHCMSAYDHYSEGDLLDALREGNAAAFDEIYQRHWSTCSVRLMPCSGIVMLRWTFSRRFLSGYGSTARM